MPNYLTAQLDFSPDPLSDTTPTYTNVTAYLLEAKWWSGKARDRDEPQPGGAEFLLKSTLPNTATVRDWEPDFAGGRWYPNVDTGRRFRWRITADGTTYDEGIYYVTDFDISYPAGTRYSVVKITCVDGFEILSNDNLELLHPPDATSYQDVVNYYEPSFYYPMNEDAGTKLVSHLRSKKWRRQHPRGRKRYRTRETAAELGGVSGPSGTYKSNPTLGVPGLILGSDDTAVTFGGSSFASVTLDADDLTNLKGLSVGCWVRPSADGIFVSGPRHTASGNAIFRLGIQGLGAYWEVLGTNSTPYQDSDVTSLTGSLHFLVGTWSPGRLRIYVDGVAIDPIGSELEGPAAVMAGNNALLLFAKNGNSGGVSAAATMAHGFVFEKELEPASVLHLWEAGAERGFAEQLAGDRIEAIATSNLWAETKIQVGSFSVQPTMQFGQSKLDEIRECVAAEQPPSQFFFDGVGDPVYLGWDYKGTGSYMTSQATFGDGAGEVPYQLGGIELDYDNEVYNDWTVSAEGGTAQTALDQSSIDARRRRANSETGLILSRDEDALAVAEALLVEFKEPALRPLSVTLSGAKPLARTQILARDIGDMVRVKRRGEGGTAIDRMTHILGWSKTLDREKNLSCTFNLARGFNASVTTWRLGITGFTELDSTAVLG